MVEAALHDRSRKWRFIAAGLAVVLALILGLAFWSIWGLRDHKTDLEAKIAEIETPERPANVCFGGKDRKTLYITARTGFYSVRMAVRGQ